MKKSALLIVPALTLGMSAFAAAPAFAAGGDSTYQAQLGQLNHSGASGTVMMKLSGDQLTVDVTAKGLAKTFNGGAFPHVSHIHIDGKGTCPPASADQNDDGVVSTPEAAEYYGTIGTTLTSSGDTSAKSALDVKRPLGQGSTVSYHRTFTVNEKTKAAIQNDTAVVVVHGLDPATLSKKAQGEKSPLTKDLPLAATAPALCGAVHASQMSMPNGAAATGGGAAEQGPQAGLLALGGSMILAAGAASVVLRRRTAMTRSTQR